MENKNQQQKIDALIDAVSKHNWSRTELTVDSGIVKTYAKKYDLEPIRVASIFNKYQKKAYAKGGKVDKTITVEVYGGKKINYTDSEIQEMIDEIDMYMSSDNLPKWIIQSRKNGNINFPKDKKGVLEFLNKIKDSKSDVYINVDSNIPTYKHYVKMAKGGNIEKQETKKNDKYFIREEYDSNGNKYNAVNLSYETGLKDIEYYKKDKLHVYENGAFYKKSTGNLSMIFRESKLYSEGGNIGECYYTIGGL
jgi:glycogen debranching enzyme